MSDVYPLPLIQQPYAFCSGTYTFILHTYPSTTFRYHLTQNHATYHYPPYTHALNHIQYVPTYIIPAVQVPTTLCCCFFHFKLNILLIFRLCYLIIYCDLFLTDYTCIPDLFCTIFMSIDTCMYQACNTSRWAKFLSLIGRFSSLEVG